MSLPILAIVSVQALRLRRQRQLGRRRAPRGARPRRRRARAAARGCSRSASRSTSPSPPALPVAAVFADRWRVGGNLVLARYVGQADAQPPRRRGRPRRTASTPWSAATARMLADFFYTLRDAGLAIYAEPAEGFPPHHYAQKHPLPPGPGDVLYVTRAAAGPACRARHAGRARSPAGRPAHGFVTSEILAFRVPRALLVPGRADRRPPSHGPPRPPPEPDPQRPAGRLDLLRPLLPRVGGARLARHRAAAHRLRALRRQGGGQPRLHRASRWSRSASPSPSRRWSAGSAAAGPTPSARALLGALRRPARARRAAGARRRHVLPHRRRRAAQRHAQPLHHGQHRQARAHPLRAAAAGASRRWPGASRPTSASG